MQKGVYPNECMNRLERFSEIRLHDKSDFYSSLQDECVSDKHYKHTAKICNVFNMNTMGNYHDLYLKADVLLLAAFYKFLSVCLWIRPLSIFQQSWIKLGCNS